MYTSIKDIIMLESAGVDSVAGETSYCSNGFPERDRLVSDVIFPNGPAIRLIPEMNFTCNGTITGFTFAGKLKNGDLDPVIQIWRENNSQPGEYYRTGADIRMNEVLCVGGFTQVFTGVFHCDLTETAQQAVRPGNVFGLAGDNTALAFARVIRGPTNHVFNEEQFLPSLRVVLSDSDSVNQDLPQIMINVSETECTRGFPNIPVFEEESIAQNSSVVTVLIPDMNFTCCETLVAFTFVGINRQKGRQDPMIQIWRTNASHPGAYYKTGPSIPVNTDNIVCADGLPDIAFRTYLCILNKDYQVSVQPGDALGLEIPNTNNDDFDILFTRGGPTNYVFNKRLNSTIKLSETTTTVPQLPQISFGLTSDQCISGFPDVVSPEGSGQGDPNKVTTRLFPEMRFGCSGNIVRFTVAVVNRNKQQSPKIQTWRVNNSEFDVYYKIGPDIPIVDRSPTCLRDELGGGIFRCTLNKAFQVSVQPGDILGLELPPENDVNFDIYFTDEGPVTYVFEERLASAVNLSEANSNITHMPQINFVVLLDSDPPNEDGSTCDFDSRLPTASMPNTQKRSSPIVAGSVIGSSIVLLLLVGFILLVVAVCIKRHRKIKKSRGNDLDESVHIINPIYGGTSQNKFPAVSYVAVEADLPEGAAHDYDEINNSGVVHIRSRTILSVNEYCQTPHSEHKNFQLITMGMEGSGASNHDIYVPSKEQREALRSCIDDDSYVYEALEKEQQHDSGGKVFQEDDTYWVPADNVNELYRQLCSKKYREIVRQQVEVTESLGSGQFGIVSKGIWQSPKGSLDVAVKQLQPGASEEEKVKFLQEAAINGQFRHPNVVQLMGVVTVGEPTMIILELLSNGSLKDVLIKMQPLSEDLDTVSSVDEQLLLKFCQHIASGMSYLAGKSFIHRDLAARNILVSKDKTCKISDFGMSHNLMDENYYISHGGKIPVKWTAPEAIHYKKYSTTSDVWSFGCVMYEIWSLGHKPFEDHCNSDAVKMIDEGYRLPPPPGLSKELYKIMIQCWQPESSHRPTFLQLVEMLSRADFELFVWEEEDLRNSDPQVKLIGAPLEVAKDLYLELQRSYMPQTAS